METLDRVQGQTKWVLDPAHSELTFKVRHLMISNVKGEFKEFNTELLLEGDDLTSAEAKVIVDTSSISTNNSDRDVHLKSEDFFDTQNYPEIIFESGSIHETNGQYRLTGFLTIKGITKEITLNVEFGGFMKDPFGNEKAGFSVSGGIDRKEFGLNWNAALETGGVMVGEEVKLSAEVQLLKQS